MPHLVNQLFTTPWAASKLTHKPMSSTKPANESQASMLLVKWLVASTLVTASVEIL